MLDKVKATHGLQPVDTTAARLFKRPRPAFLSAEVGISGGRGGRGGGGVGETAPRFQARPAARAAGSGSGAVAVAAATAAAAAASGGGSGGPGGAARKRVRDSKSLPFGAGLMSRRGPGGPAGSGKRLPATLGAMMDLAAKEPAEFARVSKRWSGRRNCLCRGRGVAELVI